MENITDIDGLGETARLFPVLSESSREGRTLSVMLACLAHIPDFSNAILGKIGRRVGPRADVSAYTEVTFPNINEGKQRPDGLIVVRTGKSVWRAFVEAKIGNSSPGTEQVEAYLRLAREVGIDAVITISNDFTSSPDISPIIVDRKLTRRVKLHHFSWYSFLTTLNVLSEGGEVEDDDHRFIFDELERFFIHPSAGLQRFTQMATSWPNLLDRMKSGVPIPKAGDDVSAVIESWHSELRDLCLLLTRKTGAHVDIKLPAKQKSNPQERVAADSKLLSAKSLLSATLIVPDAAAPLHLEADLASRTLRAVATLDAPKDKVRQASRLNWILSQLVEADGETTRLLSHWPGRAKTMESSLAEARDNPGLHSHPDRRLLPHGFSILMRMADGRKFAGRKTIIVELEQLAIDFYEQVFGQLKAWQAPAPRLRKAVEEEEAVG
ncbi:MAG: hypothetical protein KUG65_11150 [Sphingomonadaceae bacterium]|nr:hypothetical protein [Sphingomonadaceae bacterium]